MKDEKKLIKGFTLVELAIVLVIIGMLVMLGASIVGPLTRRAQLSTTRDVVKAAKEAYLSYAVKTGYVPNCMATAASECPVCATSCAATTNPWSEVGAKSVDAYTHNLVYYAAPELRGSGRDACSVGTTTLQVEDCQSGTCITRSNVAFIIYSTGQDANGQCSGASGTSLVKTPDFGYLAPCTTSATPTYNYDDVVQYVSLDEIRSARGCPQPLTVTSPTVLAQGEEDSYYSNSLQAVGGKPPYTWGAWTANGLTLNSSGLISGLINYNTATATGELANCTETINVATTVTDSTPGSTPVNYNGTVPVRPKTLSILTQSLPTATEGSSYNTSFAASGGKSSTYAWAITGCPASLTCTGGATGTIAGTPATASAGNYTINAQLSDTCPGGTAARSYVLTINPAGGSSSSTSSTSSTSSSGTSPPACTLTPNPTAVVKGGTSVLTWVITANGPANIYFFPASGGCTAVANTNGGSCTTAGLNTSIKTDFTLSAVSAGGAGSCSTSVYTDYRVYNMTTLRRDFKIINPAGTVCRRNIANNAEITINSVGNRLSYNGTIEQYSSTNGSCGGTLLQTRTFSQASTADLDNDSLVNFTAGGMTDR